MANWECEEESPTLVVGLGGIGSRIADRIAERARSLPHWHDRLEPFTSFVSLDTDFLDQNQLSHIPAVNRISLGAFDKLAVVRDWHRANNNQAFQWLDDSAIAARAGSKRGAGNSRLEARFGFFFHSPEIARRLTNLVSEAIKRAIPGRRNPTRDYDVYVYCSLAGGTGSGTFLSIAYLMQKIISDAGWRPRIVGNFLLSPMILNAVPQGLHAFLHANTYAALKELEYLTSLGHAPERGPGRNHELYAFLDDQANKRASEVSSAPFHLSFIYDKLTHAPLPSVATAVGDAAFLQVFASNRAHTAAILDNYQKVRCDLTRLPHGVADAGAGYAKDYAAMGASALVLPGEHLLEYCALRFAAESLRRYFRFGPDPDYPPADQATGSARFPPNCSAPSFFALNEEGRERLVNEYFIECVRASADKEERQGLKEGYYHLLVESVDEGRPTGVDDRGVVQRAESLLAVVHRLLGEQRRPTIERLKIKERAFMFQKEGVGQFRELVDRLGEDVRAARLIADGETLSLRRSGEVFKHLNLAPVEERYLVLRVMEECDRRWVPEAQNKVNQARPLDISSTKVVDHFENDYRSLHELTTSKFSLLRRSDKEFQAVRDDAEQFYRDVAKGSRRLIEAEFELAQYRELSTEVRRRARRYESLVRHLHIRSTELEHRAEGLRSGQVSDSRFAFSVEVFETVEEPRRRIWDRVYSALFVDEGRHLDTFAPDALSPAISRELRQTTSSGLVVDKSEEQCAHDLADALTNLGKERLAPRIFGTIDGEGLDLESGLRLEARLSIQESDQRRDAISDWEMQGYFQRKFKLLAQVSGVLARISGYDWDDGVVVSRTRRILHGLGSYADASPFIRGLREALSSQNLSVSVGRFHSRHMAVVLDLELPVPLYYFESVVGQLEEAYLRLRVGSGGGYPLHTDYHWEETLYNLNPRLSELEVRGTVVAWADALMAGVVAQDGNGHWILTVSDHPYDLGSTLSEALYRYGQYWRSGDHSQGLHAAITEAFKTLGGASIEERRQRLGGAMSGGLADAALKQVRSGLTREEVLDRLVMRLLAKLVEEEFPRREEPLSASFSSTTDGREIRIVVENADALQFRADILALKYAQSLHGLDKKVSVLLADRIPGFDAKLPQIGDFCLFPGTPDLGANQVLFIGVMPLTHFRYGEIRKFARRLLEVLARSVPTAEHIALTVHGPEQGLDEVESFQSEVAGLLEGLRAGVFPVGLKQISIVEIDERRSHRLKQLLTELLKNGRFSISRRSKSDSARSDAQIDRVLAAGYESESKPLAFVAMPFRDDMSDHYDYGIQNAAREAGFLCERADQAHFTGDILQWVKDRILKSSVVIADLSFANPNVYLEVGYAWGCGKPTILLVRQGEELKFDVKGQRCLIYNRIKDLENALKAELAALPK